MSSCFELKSQSIHNWLASYHNQRIMYWHCKYWQCKYWQCEYWQCEYWQCEYWQCEYWQCEYWQCKYCNASTGNASTGNASTGNASTGNASTGNASTGNASTAMQVLAMQVLAVINRWHTTSCFSVNCTAQCLLNDVLIVPQLLNADYIILHYSYLEWLLNYYCTWCTELKLITGRKWLGQDVSFETVLKNSERLSSGDISWQTDYSRGSFQPLEMHDRRQWTTRYVGH